MYTVYQLENKKDTMKYGELKTIAKARDEDYLFKGVRSEVERRIDHTGQEKSRNAEAFDLWNRNHIVSISSDSEKCKRSLVADRMIQNSDLEHKL